MQLNFQDQYLIQNINNYDNWFDLLFNSLYVICSSSKTIAIESGVLLTCFSNNSWTVKDNYDYDDNVYWSMMLMLLLLMMLIMIILLLLWLWP